MTFKNKVYRLIKKIPRGKVATYGQIAKLAGKPGAARAVGVLLKNNLYIGVPCHRVVGAKGELVGYSKGERIKSKKQILENEGVFFKGDRVDLEKSGWKPKKRSSKLSARGQTGGSRQKGKQRVKPESSNTHAENMLKLRLFGD